MMEFKYMMKTDDGRMIAVKFRNPISVGDEIHVFNPRLEQFKVFQVLHQSGGGSTIVCDRM